jgi:myosin V
MYAIRRETAAAVIVQKYVRRWLLRRAHLQACLSALLIQSYVRGFITRLYFSAIREHKAATVIQVPPPLSPFSRHDIALNIWDVMVGFIYHIATLQSTWRRRKVVMLFQHYRQATVAIQCAWRQKLARRELRRLKMVIWFLSYIFLG